ncbi:MAG TPA: Na/Pi cotransporter family protein, partial [Bacteroidales bacterium]|nr:Na/Pi cotransporter family protein [Bacteroidales bacterium]
MNITGIISFTAQVIGSLALFLFGMKYMSEALQKLSGNKLRNVLASFTSNRFKAALTGVLVTTVIQSSSATTVMVVSFVNAGILNLTNAIGVIMGSNIGTTATAWIITLFGIKYDISAFSIPLIGLGFILMMFKERKSVNIGEFLIGFGILFLGLLYLKDSFSSLNLAENPDFIQFMKGFVTNGSIHYGTILLCVLIGTLLTIVLQSSSAMMAVTIVLCSQGAIPFEMALALVLGENIGTTFTANIAATIGNIQAKKSARAHLIFNVIGVIWILVIFRLIVPFINELTLVLDGSSPFVEAAAIPFALSLFHSLFNIVNTGILIWFVPQIEKLSGYLVKQKEDEEEIFKLQYIDSGFVKLGELGLGSAKKEIQVFAKRVLRMYAFIPQLINLKDRKQYRLLLERVEHYESISDQMEIEIANYLTKLSSGNLTDESTLRIRGMLRAIDNLESIADQNFQLAKMIDDKNERKVWFSPKMREDLDKMFNLVNNALQIMNENLHKDYQEVEILSALDVEEKINAYRN